MANGFATLADAAIGVAPPEEQGYLPGPFAFADMNRVSDWLTKSRWQPDSAARVSFDYVVGEGRDPLEDALSFLSKIGPAARALAQAAPPERERLLNALGTRLAEYRVGDRITLPATAWIWQATA